MSSPDTQVVPASAGAVLKPMYPILAHPTYLKDVGDGLFTSIDNTNSAGQFRLYAAIQGESYKLADAINKVIQIKDVVIHPAQKVDPETDEVESWLRVVFINEKDELISCASIGVIKALSVYCTCFKLKPPFDPPAAFQVRQINSGAKRYYTLDAVQLPAKKK